MTDIRQLKHTHDGLIYYTLDHSENWIVLPQRSKSVQNIDDAAPLYISPRPISRSKFEHLQELKAVIERDNHTFYDSLTFEP